MFKAITHTTSLLSILFLLSACGAGDINDLLDENATAQPTLDAEGNYAGDVVIDLLIDSPKVSTQSGGITNVVLQFIPRDNNGFSLSSEQINIELELNNAKLSPESYLKSNASELQFNVNFGLVLDASYSMVDSQSFTPMLNAASQSIQTGTEIWEKKSGDFNFHTVWFNSFIFSAEHEVPNWTADDIKNISPPASAAGGSTKLFAAVDFMVDKFNALPTLDKPAEAPTDQNIILVFSDGKDEYSWFDNSYEQAENASLNSGAGYVKMGYKGVDLTDAQLLGNDLLIPSIEQSKNLTIHVIGLGDDIEESDLRKIAKAGRGTFRKNPDAADLSTVFNKVVQEFSTLQTRGASMTLLPGTYTFTLRVTNKSGNKSTEYSFDFITDLEKASIVNASAN